MSNSTAPVLHYGYNYYDASSRGDDLRVSSPTVSEGYRAEALDNAEGSIAEVALANGCATDTLRDASGYDHHRTATSPELRG